MYDKKDKLKMVNEKLQSIFQVADKMDRGFISKTQIQAFFPLDCPMRRKLKKLILDFFKDEKNFYLDILGFFETCHSLISLGMIDVDTILSS